MGMAFLPGVDARRRGVLHFQSVWERKRHSHVINCGGRTQWVVRSVASKEIHGGYSSWAPKASHKYFLAGE